MLWGHARRAGRQWAIEPAPFAGGNYRSRDGGHTIGPMNPLRWIRDWVAGHKKAAAAVLGGIVALIPDRYLDDGTKQKIVEIVIAFCVGQGIADNGKEAALLKARTPGALPKSEIVTPAPELTGRPPGGSFAR